MALELGCPHADLSLSPGLERPPISSFVPQGRQNILVQEREGESNLQNREVKCPALPGQVQGTKRQEIGSQRLELSGMIAAEVKKANGRGHRKNKRGQCHSFLPHSFCQKNRAIWTQYSFLEGQHCSQLLPREFPAVFPSAANSRAQTRVSSASWVPLALARAGDQAPGRWTGATVASALMHWVGRDSPLTEGAADPAPHLRVHGGLPAPPCLAPRGARVALAEAGVLLSSVSVSCRCLKIPSGKFQK